MVQRSCESCTTFPGGSAVCNKERELEQQQHEVCSVRRVCRGTPVPQVGLQLSMHVACRNQTENVSVLARLLCGSCAMRHMRQAACRAVWEVVTGEGRARHALAREARFLRGNDTPLRKRKELWCCCPEGEKRCWATVVPRSRLKAAGHRSCQCL